MEPLSRASVEGVASLDLEDESVARRAGVASINLRQCGVSLRTQAQFNCMPLSKQVCLSLFVPCYSSHLVPPSFLPHYWSLHADVRVGCYIPCHKLHLALWAFTCRRLSSILLHTHERRSLVPRLRQTFTSRACLPDAHNLDWTETPIVNAFTNPPFL